MEIGVAANCEYNDCYGNWENHLPAHPKVPRVSFIRRCSQSSRLPITLEPLQIGADVRGVLVAEISILLQTLVDDLFQLRRYVRIQSECWRWRSIQNGFEDHTARVASERKHARTHLIQDRPEREQVGASIEFLSSRLFRGHVSHRAQSRTGTGQMFPGLDGCCAQGDALRLQGDLSQPEIENLCLSSVRHEDVRGFDRSEERRVG